VLDAAGLPAYETSNHARPGEACRHNLVYWRTGDYAGIGPGAHGRLTRDGTRWATRTHRAPEIWLERVEAAGHGEHPREAVAPRARAEETLMMGLRLTEGVPLARIEADADRPWTEVVDAGAARALAEAGLVSLADGRLTATAEGSARLDGLLARLLA
jgi:oxygen-independent coproporphyrinogen-3 oxidase